METPYTAREDPNMRFFETLNSLVSLSVFMSRDHRLGYLVHVHYYGNRTRVLAFCALCLVPSF